MCFLLDETGTNQGIDLDNVLGGWLFVPLYDYSHFSSVGVCLPGGDPDQLHCGDSLCGPPATGPQHLLPSVDRLACLLWTLEPHHDSFPLLQSCQNLAWVSPYGRI